MRINRRLIQFLLLAAGGVAALLAYWYLQSPIPSGLYPARLGGIIASSEPSPVFDLPVVWVRPHPWARFPPELQRAALVGEAGNGPLKTGNWSASLQWRYSDRPAWLQPRAIMGHVSLDFPAEGLTVTGVRWQLQGEPEKLYRTGPLQLLWQSPKDQATLSASGWYNLSDTTSVDLGSKEIELAGLLVFLQGHGRIVDIINSVAGSAHPIQGLLYRTGRETMLEVHRYDKPEYQPVRFPLEHAGDATLYIPFTPEAKERMRDTYWYLSPLIVVEGKDGRRPVVANFRESGLRTEQDRWRYWVPYFVYTPE